ncbi:hypothetical protein FEM48_Zijuj05G0035700 [Ziziphus jujuba var. spinosa]|uniref:Pentatricopeptide repeat-containing protein n=1 Tax=Ziziphus jujuba var. spinosa TaxID=714518 RepID=A0A978VCK8_ZIZJJ|nr:hypothetical protein FEM48_Zijuj05G0035700 [Ziziphus jujuba var. spinosa]
MRGKPNHSQFRNVSISSLHFFNIQISNREGAELATHCKLLSLSKCSLAKPIACFSIFYRLNHLNPQLVSAPCPEKVADFGVRFILNHPNSEISSFPRKGFSEITKEINGRALHGLCVKACDKSGCKFSEGVQVHGFVVKIGLLSDVFVGTSLLHFYGTYGHASDAQKLFEEMPDRNVVTWTSLIVGYTDNGELGKSIDTYKRMRMLHAISILAGLQGNLVVGNALVTMYGKSGIMTEAKKVSQTMPKRDEVTWNALIGSHAENEQPNEAIKAFNMMREEGIPENYITMVNVLGGCLTPDGLRKHGMPIHGHIVVMGFEFDKYVQSSLITMYANCGDLSSGNSIFYVLANKNSITWNAIIAAYAHNGYAEEALKMILKMRNTGIDLDQFSFSVALSVSGDLAVLEEGQQLHCLAVKLGFESDHYVTNAAMSMYGKCGEMDDVLRILPAPINSADYANLNVFARDLSFKPGSHGIDSKGSPFVTKQEESFTYALHNE